MATKEELKKKWEPVTKYESNFIHAIGTVLFEEGVQVPLVRMFAHCMIESQGDSEAVSGPNKCCSDFGPYTPGIECSPDCRAHGLFQIYWPICGTLTDWNKVSQVNYNSYLGAKYLACAFKICGTWRKASRKFFTGNCEPTGTIDPNTGTSEDKYDQLMTQYMSELAQIGFDKDPEIPKVTAPPTDGSTNTPTANDPTCFDIPFTSIHVCPNQLAGVNPLDNLNPTAIIQSTIDSWLPRIALIVIGVLLLAIGAYTLINSGSPIPGPL
jgi:hypothetical protein